MLQPKPVLLDLRQRLIHGLRHVQLLARQTVQFAVRVVRGVRRLVRGRVNERIRVVISRTRLGNLFGREVGRVHQRARGDPRPFVPSLGEIRHCDYCLCSRVMFCYVLIRNVHQKAGCTGK